MSYNIISLNQYNIEENTEYFLDANIWLIILQPKISLSHNEIKYIAFFEKIIANTKCKIVLSSLVLSEVINRILRDVHMEKYIRKLEKEDPNIIIEKGFYKNTFRNSDAFIEAYSLISQDIKNYHNSIKLIGDGFGSDFRYKNILDNLPKGLDFNDYYYYNLCKKYNYILVTDDKDFWVENIKVVTLSVTLITKQQEFNIKMQMQN